MGPLLIVLGILFWFLVSPTLGIICLALGVILLFVPHTYGYSDWRARRRGPPV